MTSRILHELVAGDMRTIGRSQEVVDETLDRPELFAELFEGLFHEQPGMRMRSADALEKISARRPDLLIPFKRRLIIEGGASRQQEVQWHVAQMLARLSLTDDERDEVMTLLSSYLDSSPSSIVRVCALQTLANIASRSPVIQPLIAAKIRAAIATGPPALANRGAKLLRKLGN